jgi:hypothetical protein
MKIYLTAHFLCLVVALQAQFPFPHERYRPEDGCFIEYTTIGFQKHEILSDANKQMIIDSVHRTLINYKVQAYSSLYKLDSIFPDSLVMAEFKHNPYILEYPELKGYQFTPKYTVSSLMTGNTHQAWYCFFEVRLDNPYFVRKNNVADTIQYDVSTKICGLYDRNVIVFFHTPTKTLHMMGGCLPVYDLPESSGCPMRDDKYGYMSMIEIYAQARTAGICPFSGIASHFRYLAPQDWGIDSIGSMKVGRWEDGYHRYWNSDRFWSTDLTDQRGISHYPAAWIIQIRKPQSGGWAIDHHTNKLTEVVKHEEWDDVEAIQFSSPKNFFTTVPGYQPGYKAYEVRIKFKKRPTPDDSNIKLRGLTDDEIKKLRDIKYLRPFRPGIWDKY